MGSIFSRDSNEVQEIDTDDAITYTYPPVSGNFFGPHFYMGGKKFDMIQPEGYLFGDNADLNMLGPKPANFPYHVPSGLHPVRALKCLINIRKDTLRLIRIPNLSPKPNDVISTNDVEVPSDEVPKDSLYNLEFTFDSECPCSITIYYNASEEMNNKIVMFNSTQHSETIHYNTGCNQQFCSTGHIINPSKLHQPNRPTKWDFTNIPIVIQANAECEESHVGHSHILYANFEKVSEESWSVKPIKQKQAINGVCFLIQEIYGIENKAKQPTNGGDLSSSNVDINDDDDDSSECVVCLSDMRDTLILPCKHLCLCSSCANQLRFQQSGCPICRQSFRALLQIRAIRRKNSLSPPGDTIAEDSQQDDQQSVDTTGESEQSLPFEVSIPPGFEVVPLINAINGPVSNGTRTSSAISNLSSTPSVSRSSRKKKNKSSLEVESEVGGTDGPSTSTSSLNSRKRKSKRRSARKEKQENPEPEIVTAATEQQSEPVTPVYQEISEIAEPERPPSDRVENVSENAGTVSLNLNPEPEQENPESDIVTAATEQQSEPVTLVYQEISEIAEPERPPSDRVEDVFENAETVSLNLDPEPKQNEDAKFDPVSTPTQVEKIGPIGDSIEAMDHEYKDIVVHQDPIDSSIVASPQNQGHNISSVQHPLQPENNAAVEFSPDSNSSSKKESDDGQV